MSHVAQINNLFAETTFNEINSAVFLRSRRRLSERSFQEILLRWNFIDYMSFVSEAFVHGLMWFTMSMVDTMGFYIYKIYMYL